MDQNQINPETNLSQPVEVEQAEPQHIPEQSPKQQVPVEPSRTNKNLLLYVIILILLMIIGGLSWYIFQQKNQNKSPRQQSPVEVTETPLPTSNLESQDNLMSNWKAYTNDQFIIKYPSEFSLEENNLNTGAIINTSIASDLQYENGNTIYYSFDVQIDPLENFNFWSTHPTTEVLESETINGIIFKKFIVADMFESLNYIIATASGDMFRFHIWPYDQNNQNLEINSYAKQILSTVEFVDQKTETNNWQVYQNNEYNLLFKYPKSLHTNLFSKSDLSLDIWDDQVASLYVSIPETDSVYMIVDIHKSELNPVDWWNTFGKAGYLKISEENAKAWNTIEKMELTFKTEQKTFSGLSSLYVSGDAEPPTQTLGRNFSLNIVQNNGYIFQVRTHEMYDNERNQLIAEMLDSFEFAN